MTDICPICCNPKDAKERIEKLESVLVKYIADGRLQTFADRERFREEASKVLEDS